MPGVPHGLMRLGLLVPALVIRHDGRVQLLVLLQGLAHTGHVPVPEDAESSRNQPLTVLNASNGVHRVLLRKILDDGLGDRHSAGGSS